MSDRFLVKLAGACVCVFVAPLALAESVWVSDQFEITMRSGPSTGNAITRMLSSGTQLDVLETDADNGYTRVQTMGGTEGWVLTRYLMGEPPAREQLERLTRQLTNANQEGSSLGSQLQAIQSQYDQATSRIRELERERDRLQTELTDLQKKAANVLAIDKQNKTLNEQLHTSEVEVDTLVRENDSLKKQTNRNWFITGSLVLTGGILLGLVLPRIKFQRRSRYDRL